MLYQYTKAEFAILPLRPGTKIPSAPRWNETLACDNMMYDELPERYGVKIPSEGWLVIDHDAYKDTACKIEDLGYLPPTFTVRSQRGGMHYYYRCMSKIAKNLPQFPGVDFLGHGCQVVGPGTEGYTVVINGVDLLDAPDITDLVTGWTG